ncbi:hypothetical protein [Streptomyces yanii]|uniref:hypothetical protein n=1 Tax=Streptomyces yanii TaxID=78510 RepID=UPI0031E5BC28
MATTHADALRSQRGIWIDAHPRRVVLDLGALPSAIALTENSAVADDIVHFELFEGGHHAVEYRMPPALAWLSVRIAIGLTSRVRSNPRTKQYRRSEHTDENLPERRE